MPAHKCSNDSPDNGYDKKNSYKCILKYFPKYPRNSWNENTTADMQSTCFGCLVDCRNTFKEEHDKSSHNYIRRLPECTKTYTYISFRPSHLFTQIPRASHKAAPTYKKKNGKIPRVGVIRGQRINTIPNFRHFHRRLRRLCRPPTTPNRKSHVSARSSTPNKTNECMQPSLYVCSIYTLLSEQCSQYVCM